MLAAGFNLKAKRWVAGRKGVFARLQQEVDSSADIAWFHCASLGEFEQGRPVIEAYRAANPGHKILLTFFSPSGYEVQKGYEGADYIYYLPMDYPGNAKKFVQLVKPKVAVFVKYEFWHHFIKELNRSGTPAFVISANFRKDQHFFKWYGSWFIKTLQLLQHIYVQSEDSRVLLEKAGVTNASVGGDTRFDRVADVGEKDEELPMLSAFTKDVNVLVAGSTWPDDEQLLKELITSGTDGVKYIIAPHEVNPSRIAGLMKALGMGAICYSEATEQKLAAARVLVIDSVGLLSKLYKYGSLAYIGGGFNAGIHNILEPAAFGLPVLFGPRHGKFREAVELISKGGAFPVEDYATLKKGVRFLLDDHHAGHSARLSFPRNGAH
jgi:3-deoxy-D-manno-octulosonic-acid transferase